MRFSLESIIVYLFLEGLIVSLLVMEKVWVWGFESVSGLGLTVSK